MPKTRKEKIDAPVDLRRVPTNIWARRKKGNAKFTVDLVRVAAVLSAAGMSDSGIETMLGVTHSTINRWRKSNPELDEALRQSKKAALKYLKASALQLAVGYDYYETEQEYVTDPETGEERLAKKRVKVRHQPPNVSMLMFLLCNMTRYDDEETFKNLKHIETESKTLEVRTEVPSDKLIDALSQRLESRRKQIHSKGVNEGN